VEEELEKMVKLGWIERSDSEYASPMVIVKKRDSSDIRICVSYESLNEITEILVNLSSIQPLMHVKGFMPLKWKNMPRST
jgi:hypothetical protein